MADILPFAKGASTPTRYPRKAAGEIVIFPGVRVEYHDGPPTPPATPRQRRAKRNSAANALTA